MYSAQAPLSPKWLQNRSERIFRLTQYNWIIVPTIVLIVYNVLRWTFDQKHGGYVEIKEPESGILNSIVLAFLLRPAAPATIISFLTYCFPLKPFHLSKQPIQRDFRRLLICLVTRGDQKEVVHRSISAIQDIYQTIDQRISLHILTEDARAESFRGTFRPHVLVHGVPAEFKPSKAKYKARSLEWFRINMQLEEHDWVLHIDEEALLDDYCIRSCIDFITKQNNADIGQGVIHFNCHDYWSSVFTGVADVNRVKNDFGDVQWRLNWLGKAAVGIRGSSLLIRGSVENACTWDTDSLTEDYAFCLEAIRKGYCMGFIPGIARELSPSCIGDLVRQRRRWYTGVRGLGDFWGQLFLLRTAITGLQAFDSVACWFRVYPWPSWTVQQPQWVYNWTVLETSIGIGITAWILFLQDYDTGLSLEDMLAHQVLAVLVQPFVQIAEGYAVLVSTFFPDTWFFVIKKT